MRIVDRVAEPLPDDVESLKRLLLAELDLRLKLVSELIAALAGEPGGAG